ncbi:MAG TPA: hypothetical protein P5038_04130 [Candidatus Paceibacterota bacterium]|nr:hypothetical protein [Candidatus Paceibacterota bacterium]
MTFARGAVKRAAGKVAARLLCFPSISGLMLFGPAGRTQKKEVLHGITCDRRGRRAQVTQGGITTTLAYNDADLPLSESHSGGPHRLRSPEGGALYELSFAAVESRKIAIHRD